MNLEALKQGLAQPGIDLDRVLKQKQDGDIQLTEPLNPPSGWTRFKAALSDIPLLGQIGSLQQARAECESYPVRLQQYQTGNRQILAGLVSDMREKYGDNIANMAVRDLHHTDGAPLTGRTVSTMLEQAEKTQASYRSWNNQTVTRFLESGLSGGGRGRGETDMIGICLERSMKLGGEDQTWKGMVSPQAARFIEHQVMQNCKALPEYSQGHLGNAQIAQAAQDALDLYNELLTAPGMTPTKLDTQISRVSNSFYKAGGQAAANSLREFIIMESAAAPMDRKNPDSMLSRAAKSVTDKLGLPPLSDGVLKSISDNMLEGLRYRTQTLHEELGCERNVSVIIDQLGLKLEKQVQRAVSEHVEALGLIRESTTLTPAAKETLLAIAQNRRIDPVQVRTYESIPQSVNAIGECLRQNHTGASLDALQKSFAVFEQGLQNMKQYGHGMWENNSLEGGDVLTRMFEQVAMIAAQSHTREEARELLDLLTGPQGVEIVSSIFISGDMKMITHSLMFYLSVVEAMAMQAGHTPEEARNIAEAMEKEPESSFTLDKLTPTVARLIVGSATKDVDSRGVVSGSRNGRLVSSEFNPRQVIDEQRGTITDYVSSNGPGSKPWLSKTMEVDVGRATYYMQGKLIGNNGGESAPTFESFRGAFPEGPAGDTLALGVSRCMNQNGLNTFFEFNNQSAFPGKTLLFTGNKTAHEAWPNGDGSWSVRSTLSTRPNGVSPDSINIEEIESDGAALYTLTYRIEPPRVEGGQAGISIVDSRVAFEF